MCNQVYKPTVFTRVSSFLDWIFSVSLLYLHDMLVKRSCSFQFLTFISLYVCPDFRKSINGEEFSENSQGATEIKLKCITVICVFVYLCIRYNFLVPNSAKGWWQLFMIRLHLWLSGFDTFRQSCMFSQSQKWAVYWIHLVQILPIWKWGYS